MSPVSLPHALNDEQTCALLLISRGLDGAGRHAQRRTLMALGLIEKVDGVLVLTEAGRDYLETRWAVGASFLRAAA